MTTQEWLSKVQTHKENLSNLIVSYHPNSNGYQNDSLPITAFAPEAACEVVREKIRAESNGENPIAKFHAALESGDFDTIYSLLSEVWYGVPESTSCWVIPGFAEAVDLMDDLPEEMYAESL